MAVSRIYQSVSLILGQLLRLDEKASHHLARVLRVSIGETVTLFNGEGGEFEAVIRQIEKKQVTVELMQFMPREVESPVFISLAQGIARGEKMDFIIQKAVELGANEIIPLITERCGVRLDQPREEKRMRHWQSIVISACEQCGRNRVPVVRAPMTLPDWLVQAQAEIRFVLSPHVKNQLSHRDALKVNSIALLIGPEGGLSDEEMKMAAARKFIALNLGPRVLRTETATIAALAVMLWLILRF